ncbi:MAG: preprotein translocase subunit SecE [Armatimonadota bacterium]|nr:preprotein translocase subunit SecE [Armatimonadota bacterium]
MADKLTKSGKPAPPGPKKGVAPTNSRMEQAQKRAQAITSGRGKATPPKQFLEEAWVELKKTTWPSREETYRSTIVVLALVIATGIFVYFADALLFWITDPLFKMH